ncbi:hypothetical protein [Azospirillum sp. B4]|uniref:hypothetical protein n=1 Tax=Azospirillum sp. B4 TaxID=95605 RepID=UPI0011DD529D|nr:hypothetical protein [Azospirillum sp. B4]
MNATMQAATAPAVATLGRGRRLLMAPGVHARLPARPPAVTRLGQIAQALVEQTVAATLSLAVTSTHLHALAQMSAPAIVFQELPPFPSPLGTSSLQAAYNALRDQLAVFRSGAESWITPRRGAEMPSVLSQLASMPRLLADITRTLNDALVGRYGQTAGQPACTYSLKVCERALRRQGEAVSALLAAASQQGQWLATTAGTLVGATQTGPLGQLLAAYGGEVKAMTTAVEQARAGVAAEAGRIIGAGVGTLSSLTAGVVGLTLCWNPQGWAMIPGGAIGMDADLGALQAQLGKLEALIEVKVDRWRQEQAAALLLAGMRVQLQGVAPMLQATQEELAALVWLLGTLPAEMSNALGALEAGEREAAREEWNAVMADAALSDTPALHLWPSPTHLSAPSKVAVAGDDIFRIGPSGRMYQYCETTRSWTDMKESALSCVSDGYDLVAIDGAPATSAGLGMTGPSSYQVKLYDRFTQAWAVISTFPATCVAVGDGDIYAVSQATGDGRIHRYNGKGKSWTALPMLPGPDVAAQIAVAGGVVFALANNSQTLYRYNVARQSWGRVGRFACQSIRAGGGKLGIVDADNRAYLHDPAAGGAPRQVGVCVGAIAPLSTGDQLAIASHPPGALWHIDTTAQPPQRTHLAPDAVAVFAGDAESAYYTDARGAFHRLTLDGATVTLPPLPEA